MFYVSGTGVCVYMGMPKLFINFEPFLLFFPLFVLEFSYNRFSDIQ